MGSSLPVHRSHALGAPVKSPGDMGGIAVRSQESPVHTGLWKALGANPIVMEISEVQGKLEKG